MRDAVSLSPQPPSRGPGQSGADSTPFSVLAGVLHQMSGRDLVRSAEVSGLLSRLAEGLSSGSLPSGAGLTAAVVPAPAVAAGVPVEGSPEETAAAPAGQVEAMSLPFAPAGAGLLGDILPIDVAAVERGLQSFLEELAGSGASAVAGLSGARPVGWFLVGLVGTALVVEVTRRRFREPAVVLLGGSVEDSTGTWPSF